MSRFSTRTKIIAGGAALFILGAVAGGAASRSMRPVPALAPATVQPVSAATAADARQIVAVRGQVTGVYGGAFTLKDASGQTLVSMGRHHGQPALVAAGETVTVQGHARHGSLRAVFLVTPDGKTWAVGGKGGHHGGRHGERDGRGPDEGGAPAPVAPDVPVPPAPTTPQG